MRMTDFNEEVLSEKELVKNSYDAFERQEIYGFCRKFSRNSFPSDKTINEGIKEEVLKPYFLRSLSIFDSELITDYFNEKIQGLKVVKSKSCTSDEISLKYSYTDGRPVSLKLVMPRTNLTMNDQLGYAHEIGHIPELEKLRKSYVEYDEVLPMFLEFITQLRRYRGFQNAFDNFLFVRLPMEQEAARDIMKMCKELGKTNINENQRRMIADWYSFLESLEYVIQLIYRTEDDLEAVTEEIEKILGGKSLIDVASSLDIVTDGCPSLQKEYKRVGKM